MYVFSTLALTQMAAGLTWTSQHLGVVLLTRCPEEPDPDAPQPIGDATHTGLVHTLGYSEQVDPGYTRTSAQVSSSTGGGTTVVVLGEDFLLPTSVNPAFIRAAAYYWIGTLGGQTNPWLWIDDATFNQVVYAGSTLTTYSQAPRALLTYSLRGTTVDTFSGGMVRSPGQQVWEPPRVQHVYLYPERINYSINPSFEDGGLFGWRADGTLTRTVGGVDLASNHYGSVSGTRLEGLPINVPAGAFRVSAYVRAHSVIAEMQIGLSIWDGSWQINADRLGRLELVTDSWTRLDALIAIPDDVAGAGLVVVADGDFDCDLTMIEHTAQLHNYFDGDSQTGMVGDFSWQGVTHQSLAFWYNNRNLVGARLFGSYVEGATVKQGLVYDWVPEGTAIYTHWDITSPDDTGQPFSDWASRVIP